MVANDEARLADAARLWSSGNIDAAVKIYVELSRGAQTPDIGLQSALILVEKLNPSLNVDIILDAASTGINLAEQLGDRETKTYLMAMRAKNLAIANMLLRIARKNLKLAPNWLGFSLEIDERRYQELTDHIVANDEESDRLVREALKVTCDDVTLGHVLLCLGDIAFQQYMSLKIDCLRQVFPLPKFIRNQLRTLSWDEYFWCGAPDRRSMRKYLEVGERQYRKAAAAFHTVGDDLNVARAYYGLANNLRSANRFRRAKHYLEQAEAIAKLHNDKTLLNHISALSERIRQRNRNVPNYAAGES